jgi:Galactose-3-O-sulfotransferase
VTHDVDEAVQLAERIVVLTARPGRIADVLTVDLPHPRDIGRAEYGRAKNRLYELLGVSHNIQMNRVDAQDTEAPAGSTGLSGLMGPDEYSGQSPLFYLHIPKAGGSSLLGVVEGQYAPGEMLVIYDVDFRSPADIAQIHGALSARKQKQLRLIAGHFGFGAHSQVGSKPAYFTMLREPTGRVISNYRHMMRSPRVKQKDIRGISLDTFLDEQRWIDSDNGQVRRLCGMEFEGHLVPFGSCSQEMLECAKNNLSRYFPAFGIMEEFDLSLQLFQRSLGWSDVRYTLENLAPRASEPVSQATREKIQRLNAFDIELYAYAKQLFFEKTREVGLDANDVPSMRTDAFGLKAVHKVRIRTRRLRRALLRRLGARFRAH